MTMRRVIARAMEELTAATEGTPRREPFTTELYNLSDYLTDAKPRPLPKSEAEFGDEKRPPRPRSLDSGGTPRRRSGVPLAHIRGLLSTQAGVRQALIMKEVLGAPKALRRSDESKW